MNIYGAKFFEDSFIDYRANNFDYDFIVAICSRFDGEAFVEV